MPIIGLFIVWSLLELLLLIMVSDALGAFMTIILLIFGMILGLWLIRRQQIRWLASVQEQVSNQTKQAQEMREGLYQIIGGIFLFLPGFLSDIVALFFLIPVLRAIFGQQMMKILRAEKLATKFRYYSYGQTFEHSDEVYAEDEQGRVVEAELIDDNRRQ